MFGSIIEGKSYIFFGKKGTGKSAMAMRIIRDFHRRGRTVWVNFDIWKGPMTEESDAPIWKETEPEGVLSMRDGLFVLDEAQLKINCRNWRDMPESVLLAWTMARKLDMTVIVIAQGWKRIDVSLREVTDIARKMQGASLLGHMFNFIDYEVDDVGDIVKVEEAMVENDHRAGWGWIRKKDFESYDTKALFGVKPPARQWQSAVKEKVEEAQLWKAQPSLLRRLLGRPRSPVTRSADTSRPLGETSWKEAGSPTIHHLQETPLFPRGPTPAAQNAATRPHS